MAGLDSKRAHLAGMVLTQLRDCETTVAMLDRFPAHISRLSAQYTAILVREGVVNLPRDARGVRIRMEMANNRSLSRPSFDVVCDLTRDVKIKLPARGTPAYKTASAIFTEMIA